jgi:hypothetical protein
VAISDVQFKGAVAGAAGVLVLGITMMRFCGSVSLPDKPAPQPPSGNAQQLVELEHIAGRVSGLSDEGCRAANVRVPTVEDMSRKLLFRVDEGRQVLEVGERPIESAGLRLTAKRSDDKLVLDIENITKSDLAYHVVSESTPKIAGCSSIAPLTHNAIIIAKGEHQIRVECAWRAGMAIVITRTESMEVSPLSAWYLNQVPPAQVGIEDRVGRGHRVPKSAERCIALTSQAVRSGLENGEIQWRDLVDFYARHRCQTYPFPASYRALTADGQRRIPAS